MLRDNVCVTETLTTSAKFLLVCKFSRIRSNTTIVALIEYPTRVSIQAINVFPTVQRSMKELAKLRKIIDRELPGAAKETLLVLDATTGQNGLIQARQFKETAGLTGIVLTKLDGTAKGGIVIAIAQELRVPVKYVGLGEGIKDLAPFDAKEFVGDLF